MKKNTLPKKYAIPIEGSLGLLALGHQGLVAWREKRDKNQPLLKKNKDEKKK